jgi:sodium transport system permease protein
MRWSIVRLIAGKELRDLIRDRRTVFLILILPVVLYPLFGVTGYVFAAALLGQTTVVGVAGLEHLPSADSGLPSLVVNEKVAEGLDADEQNLAPIKIKALTDDFEEALRLKRCDVVLVLPPNLTNELKAGRRPTVTVRAREGDDKSKLAARRLSAVLKAWEGKVLEKRFADHGLPTDFHKALTIVDPQTDKPKGKKAADELRDTFTRVFPFILIMWLVAGAVQPAVDMTAGEKERGTMETLLISPAERVDIVVGKFLATTTFSFASVVWNVVWLTGAGVVVELALGFPILNYAGMLGCVVLGLPLAMLFSAVSLAFGVVAKSTKEGQYYLLPLILVTMPLAFWSMTPGAELTLGSCWVPVTGAMLLQQRLLTVSGEPIPWEYFAPVLGSLFVWVSAALAFASWQFRREGVLFRETGSTGGGLIRGLFKRSAN